MSLVFGCGARELPARDEEEHRRECGEEASGMIGWGVGKFCAVQQRGGRLALTCGTARGYEVARPSLERRVVSLQMRQRRSVMISYLSR
jgi:hypothetical protein